MTCTDPGGGRRLPVHLTWHGLREFDVALEKPRLLLYSIVLSQGRRTTWPGSSTRGGYATTGRSCARWSAARCGGPANASGLASPPSSSPSRVPRRPVCQAVDMQMMAIPLWWPCWPLWEGVRAPAPGRDSPG